MGRTARTEPQCLHKGALYNDKLSSNIRWFLLKLKYSPCMGTTSYKHLNYFTSPLKPSGYYVYHHAGKAIPLQAWTGPEDSRRLRLPTFQDNRHMKVVRLSALRTGPSWNSWYSFPLQADSTPGPKCIRKDYVNETFQWHRRELNPRPSCL